MWVRFDPFREFDRLLATNWTGTTAGTSRHAMPMSMRRDDDQVLLEFDLPGVAPDSIDLKVQGQVLTVSATRAPVQDDSLVMDERARGIFRRQLTLGDGLDTDGLEASYVNGVLYVRIPVLESARTRRIPISTEAPNGQKAIGAGAA